MYTPSLVEPGVKYFYNETLKNCNSLKSGYYNMFVNLSLFIVFVIIVSLFLYFKKQNKPSKKSLQNKELNNHIYILKKLQEANEKKLRQNNELITNLPQFNKDFNELHEKFYTQ
uniref:Uncharacterized protein n=1 Tax=viral metagenome TaxID=1070528 RepID=A0A6C0KID2_9ZZZZ